MPNSVSTDSIFYPSIADFKKSTSDLNMVFVGGTSNGIFYRVEEINKDILLDDGIGFKRKDGRIYVRKDYSEQGIIRPEWYGAKGDSITDDYEAFKKAISIVTKQKGVLVTGNKRYHLSKKLNFPEKESEGCKWFGNNAIVDNTIIINSTQTTLKDITVNKSPSFGFVWKRGQGGFFENLKASNCSSAGFGFGITKGSQVAWSTFTNLIAVENETGFLMDATQERSWINANNFVGLYSRKNKSYGLLLKGKVNYNTWTGFHCEVNDQDDQNIPAVVIENGVDNVFIGGHFVSNYGCTESVVIDKGIRTIYLGGRYVAGSPLVNKVIDNAKSKIDLSHKIVRTENRSRSGVRRNREEETFIKVGTIHETIRKNKR